MLLNAFYCFFRPLLFCLLLLAASIFFASINRERLERFSTEKNTIVTESFQGQTIILVAFIII